MLHLALIPAGSGSNNKFIMAAYQSKAFVARVECESDGAGGLALGAVRIQVAFGR